MVQLHNLKNQFNEAMESITIFFKKENDPLFYKGEKKGRKEGLEKSREEGREEVIYRLLKN